MMSRMFRAGVCARASPAVRRRASARGAAPARDLRIVRTARYSLLS
jgi:hypothetical protein